MNSNSNQTVGIFHGYGGYRPSSWLSWLDKELRDREIETIFPEFPFLGASTIEEWYQVLMSMDKKLTEPALLVGHSGGVIFSLYVVEQSKQKFEKLVLASPLNDQNGVEMSTIFDKPGREAQRPYVTNFIQQKFDYNKIVPKVKNITFVMSDNDPHVPYAESRDYYQNIFPKAKFITLHNAGHINEKAGIDKIPEVLRELT